MWIFIVFKLISPPPSAAYMHQWIGSALVQIMDCHLFAPSHYLLLSIWPLGANFSEFLNQNQNFSFAKMHLKTSSAKFWPFCPGGDKLISLVVPIPGIRVAVSGVCGQCYCYLWWILTIYERRYRTDKPHCQNRNLQSWQKFTLRIPSD